MTGDLNDGKGEIMIQTKMKWETQIYGYYAVLHLWHGKARYAMNRYRLFAMIEELIGQQPTPRPTEDITGITTYHGIPIFPDPSLPDAFMPL
jgi:hypothetical protein